MPLNLLASMRHSMCLDSSLATPAVSVREEFPCPLKDSAMLQQNFTLCSVEDASAQRMLFK